MTGLLILAAVGQLSQFVTRLGAGISRHFSVSQLSDGGYVCSGNTVVMGYRFVICRFDQNGNLSWYYNIRRSPSASEDPGGQSFARTSDGGFVVTGQVAYMNTNDLGLAKFTSTGTLSWMISLSLSNSSDFGYSVIETSDNGLVITGYTDTDILLTKFNSSGTHLWTKTIGGSGTEGGRSVIETSDGGLALVGYTNSWGAGNYDIILCKLNSAGDLQWTRTLGGPEDDLGYCVVQSADGGFVISGYTENFGAVGGDNILAKFDGSGNYLWSVVFGYGTTLDTLSSVAEGAGSILGVVSWNTPDVFTLHIPFARFDANGNFISAWNPMVNAVGPSETRYCYPGIAKTSDGGFVTVGRDLLIKYDASGSTCMGSAVTPNLIYPSPTITTLTLSATSTTPSVSPLSYSRENPSPGQTWPCNPLGEEESSSGQSIALISEHGVLRVNLPQGSYVRLSLYESTGRLAVNLYEGFMSQGEHIFTPELESGEIYLAVLVYGGRIATTKIASP